MPTERLRIERIRLREVALPLATPFVTSYGAIRERRSIIVEAYDEEGRVGYGEAAPISPPLYTEESVGTAWYVLAEYLAPAALKADWSDPAELSAALSSIRRNYAAKAGLDCAAWDLFARRRGGALGALLGGTRPRIESGIALGIPPDGRTLLRWVEKALADGYRRVKIKVKPGWDLEPLRLLRRHFGDFPLAVDANASYTPGDADHLARFDEFSLQMIEQPLDWEDIVDHAALQARLATPICLDESITSPASLRQALSLGSCRIVNIKVGRVGGLTPARALHDLCREAGVPAWCGGLLETGIGRAHSLALASLPGFTLPADLSPSSRYFEEDVIEPPVDFAEPGLIEVPRGAGLGVAVSEARLAAFTRRELVLSRKTAE